jgi:glycosyltransferase involved in cell wall biosynthesis
MVSGNGAPTIDGVGHHTQRLLQTLSGLRPEWDWHWLCRRPRWYSFPFGSMGDVRVWRPAHTWRPSGVALAGAVPRLLRPDIVHIQEQIHSFHETGAAVRLARASRARTVITLHEFHAELPSARHTAELVSAADCVIASDARTAAYCKQYAGREADLQGWSPSNLFPPEEPVACAPRLCATFGFISALKLFRPVFQALSRLHGDFPDLRWRIVGPFDPSRNAEHATLHGELGESWVEFARGSADLQDQRLKASIAEAEVMLLPFADGASPRRTSLHTAWTFGTPVITTPPPYPEPSIRDGYNCLLVPAQDTRGWENALRGLLTDPKLRQGLRAGGHETARRLSWDRLGEVCLSVYERLLGGN